VSLPFSAYNAGLGLDGETVYVMIRDAAYRLSPGKPAQKMELDLGFGSVLADSGIIFWSKGAIWNAAKQGGNVWRLATVPKQPEYIVTSGASFAWLDRAADGNFRIQTLKGGQPKVLMSSADDISAVHMVHDWVFFVQRSKDSSWRIGRVQLAGGEAEYAGPKSGPTPSMLGGAESVVYYSMGDSEVRQLLPDLKTEHVVVKDFVCSPLHEAKSIYCARVEGLFEIPPDSRQPKPLLYGRRVTITSVQANAKQVVWIVDAGPDQLRVEMLPVE
jgi:hypothetical protein